MRRRAHAQACVGRHALTRRGGAVRWPRGARLLPRLVGQGPAHPHPAEPGTIAKSTTRERWHRPRPRPRAPRCCVSASHPQLNHEGARLCSACPRRGPAESNGRVLAADTIDAFTGAAVCGVYVTLRSTNPRRLGRTVLVGSPSEVKVAGFGGRGIGQGGLTQGTSCSRST